MTGLWFRPPVWSETSPPDRTHFLPLAALPLPPFSPQPPESISEPRLPAGTRTCLKRYHYGRSVLLGRTGAAPKLAHPGVILRLPSHMVQVPCEPFVPAFRPCSATPQPALPFGKPALLLLPLGVGNIFLSVVCRVGHHTSGREARSSLTAAKRPTCR